MMKSILISLKMITAMSLLLGLAYPGVVTLIAQELFPYQAGGSLIRVGGRVIGSSLLAQKTTSEKYFWPRPSASDYGAVPSGASNLGPTSKALKAAIEERKAKGLPTDLLYSSGSGLDPDITLDAALGQVPRIVQSRHLSETQGQQLTELVHQSLEPRDFHLFGEPRVNVLLLNLKVDKAFAK